MLTKKIADFSADLLDTVRGVLGEAKKCPADCECEKCEAEDDEDEDEMKKEGYMPTADEPTEANKKTAQKIRDMMAKEKKPVKEGTKEDLAFEGPYRKAGEERKDEYGNKVKNVAKHLAKKAMKANEEVEQIDEISSDMAHRYLKGKHERDYDISPDGKSSKLKKPQSFDKMNKDAKSSIRALRTIEKAKKANEDVEHTNCGTPECCGQCDTAAPINETAKIVAHLQKRYGDNIRKSHVRSAASDFGVDASKLAKAVRAKLGKNMLGEEEQIDEISKATLGRYIPRAAVSIDSASYRQGNKEAHGSTSNALEKKLTKRHKGIETAVKKLTKEDAEQIDELSKATLGSYVKKASNQAFSKGFTGGSMMVRGDMNRDSEYEKAGEKNVHKAIKRVSGVTKAVNKLTQEEQDFVDSLNNEMFEGMDNDMPKGLEDRSPRGRARNAMGRAIAKKERNLARARKEIASRNEETGYLETDLKKRKKNNDQAVKDMKKMGSPMKNPHFGEEVEITEARGRPKKGVAKDFTIHPRTKEKLMHDNPADMARIERLQKNGILAKPKVEADEHIMNQLQKAKTSMLGGSKINFTHGDSKHVSGPHAAKILSKYAGMKPAEKADFQKFVGHSHENLMKHV
jgi:hypothetical protein